MYPIEYRWISAATPVTNRIIVVESGSVEEAEVDAEGARLDPREAVAEVEPLVGGQRVQREEGDHRPHERERDRSAVADPAGDGLADALAEQQQHDRAEGRERRDDPGQIEQIACGHDQPSSTFTSSAVTS